MSLLAIVGLLLFKHGLLAHVVDFGYSFARCPKNRRHWFIGAFTHCALEFALTYAIMSIWEWDFLWWVLFCEQVALIASGWVEQRATMRRLLHTHLLCELAVLLTYVLSIGYGGNA